MHFSKVFTLTALFAAGAFALPNAEPNNPPHKPSPPSPTSVNQNVCGNNVTPYCCTADGKGGYSSCSAYSGSSQCSQTIVCCNANDSIQVCLGNVVIGN